MTLDQSALDNIRVMDDETGALLARCLDTFARGAPTMVEDMRSALVDEDTVKLHRAAHTLKSNAANLGSLALSETCKVLETQARAGELEHASTLVACIETQLELTLTLLEDERAQATATN